MKKTLNGISVIVPAYNEEATIGELISRIRIALRKRRHEIIVIDDASTDGTNGIASRLADRVIRNRRN